MDEQQVQKLLEKVSDTMVIAEALYHYREMFDEGMLVSLTGVDVEEECGFDAVPDAVNAAIKRIDEVISKV